MSASDSYDTYSSGSSAGSKAEKSGSAPNPYSRYATQSDYSASRSGSAQGGSASRRASSSHRTVSSRSATPRSGSASRSSGTSRGTFSTISSNSGYSQGTSSYDAAARRRAAKSHYNNPSYYRGASRKNRRGFPFGSLLAGALVLAIVGIGAWFYVQSLPAKITLNGTIVNVSGKKTLADAISENNLDPQPGNLLDVEGEVITTGGGELLFASINDEKITDTTAKLKSGDVVIVSDGEDLTEDYTTTTESIPANTELTTSGWGTIHLYEGDGSDGTKEIRTGSISGKTTEVITKEPGDYICRKVYANTGDDKVICLTFDDGPWPDTTAEILDILAEYGAKATFFTIGEQIAETDYGAELIKREYDEGHQICTHTYDHANGSGQGVSLNYMSHEEQIEEITKGFAAIEAVTGTSASRVIRAPGGNYNDDTAINLMPYVSAEIYWDIDTEDWSRPGVSSIVAQIQNAWSGCIILMHDGGGDRSQTVEALKEALPYLVNQGYAFITIDELLSYELTE